MNNNKVYILLPLLAGTFWGSAGFFVRTLTEWGMSTMTLLESRAVIGTVLLGAYLLIRDRSLFKMKLPDVPVLLASALIGTLGLNVCYNISINSLTLSFSAVLLGLSPVFVVLMAAPLFGERITLKKALCTGGAVLGCVLVSGLLETGSALHWTPLGIVIGVLSGLFYALYSIFSRIAMDRGYHSLTISFYCFFSLTVVLIPFTQWDVIAHVMVSAPVRNNLIMLAHALCLTLCPYLLYNYALTKLEAGLVSVLASAEPVAAMIFGAIIYSEMPSVLSIAGLVVVLASLGILSLTKE